MQLNCVFHLIVTADTGWYCINFAWYCTLSDYINVMKPYLNCSDEYFHKRFIKYLLTSSRKLIGPRQFKRIYCPPYSIIMWATSVSNPGKNYYIYDFDEVSIRKKVTPETLERLVYIKLFICKIDVMCYVTVIVFLFHATRLLWCGTRGKV